MAQVVTNPELSPAGGHLSPAHLLAIESGEALDPAAERHLESCAACVATVEGLTLFDRSVALQRMALALEDGAAASRWRRALAAAAVVSLVCLVALGTQVAELRRSRAELLGRLDILERETVSVGQENSKLASQLQLLDATALREGPAGKLREGVQRAGQRLLGVPAVVGGEGEVILQLPKGSYRVAADGSCSTSSVSVVGALLSAMPGLAAPAASPSIDRAADRASEHVRPAAGSND